MQPYEQNVYQVYNSEIITPECFDESKHELVNCFHVLIKYLDDNPQFLNTDFRLYIHPGGIIEAEFDYQGKPLKYPEMNCRKIEKDDLGDIPAF